MELWTPVSTTSVETAYAAQAQQPALPLGSLFQQALAEYAAARHPEPVAAPQIVHHVPAESSSLFSMLHGYLRGRISRA